MVLIIPSLLFWTNENLSIFGFYYYSKSILYLDMPHFLLKDLFFCLLGSFKPVALAFIIPRLLAIYVSSGIQLTSKIHFQIKPGPCAEKEIL